MRQGRSSDSGRNDWHRWKGSHHGLCSFCILQSPAHSRRGKFWLLLAGTGNSDTRHTDKLLFAGSAAITAFLTVEVVINISPISIHRFTAAFADKHTAAFCTAYRAVVLLLPAAANAASHGANRHLAIVGLPFQQRHNCISILIVGIMVAVRRRFAVRFGIFSSLNRPQVRFVKARSDCLLNDAAIQGFLVFQIRWIHDEIAAAHRPYNRKSLA